MKRAGIAASLSAAALVASLLLARVHPLGNAGLYEFHLAASPLMERSSASPAVRSMLAEKCADCHSLQTRTPFYGRLAPISWLLEHHIIEGRRHMNLSSWDAYSADQQQTFKAKIVQQTKTHEMPLIQYRLLHWNARITDAEEQALIAWARTAPAETAAIGDTAGNGDALQGKLVFEKRCTGCHALGKNGEGPRLQGVFGRTSGSVASYAYSPALKNAHIVWDEKTLDQWLADPDTLVPGNNMEFHVAKPQERRDLINFLEHGAGK